MSVSHGRLVIAYNKLNAGLVLRVERDVRTRGISTWMATRDITPAAPRRKAIYEAIADAQALPACLSPEFL